MYRYFGMVHRDTDRHLLNMKVTQASVQFFHLSIAYSAFNAYLLGIQETVTKINLKLACSFRVYMLSQKTVSLYIGLITSCLCLASHNFKVEIVALLLSTQQLFSIPDSQNVPVYWGGH